MNPSRSLTVFLALAAMAATSCDTGSGPDGPAAEQAAKPTEPGTSTSAGPSDPAAVTKETCEHVVDVVRKADPRLPKAELRKVRSTCEESLGQLARRHHSLTTCILAAGNAEEIEACEKPAQRYDSVLSGSAPSLEAVCQHVMDIMKREMGDTTQPSKDDVDKFEHKCVADLTKEREKLGAEEFRKQSRCVLAANQMEDMMRCEPDKD